MERLHPQGTIGCQFALVQRYTSCLPTAKHMGQIVVQRRVCLRLDEQDARETLLSQKIGGGKILEKHHPAVVVLAGQEFRPIRQPVPVQQKGGRRVVGDRQPRELGGARDQGLAQCAGRHHLVFARASVEERDRPESVRSREYQPEVYRFRPKQIDNHGDLAHCALFARDQAAAGWR